MRLDGVPVLLGALERNGVRYAVFGGLAMAAHGNVELPRRALGTSRSPW